MNVMEYITLKFCVISVLFKERDIVTWGKGSEHCNTAKIHTITARNVEEILSPQYIIIHVCIFSPMI